MFWLAERGITPKIPRTLTYGDHSVPTVAMMGALVIGGEAARWYRE